VLRILSIAVATAVVVLAVASAASADSTPIGPLPKHPVSTVSTHPGLLVSVALPHQAASTGLVWRLARRVDSAVLRQVSEADVGKTVVVVFKVVGKGKASVVFALTRGDSSPKAVRAITTAVRVS
jgi:hypothetical protein